MTDILEQIRADQQPANNHTLTELYKINKTLEAHEKTIIQLSKELQTLKKTHGGKK